MKAFLLILGALLTAPAFAAQPLTTKGISYLPVFSYDSTSSVAFTSTQGSTSAINSANGEATILVRILTTSAAYIDIGTNPNPNTSKIPLPANTESIVEIVAGHRIGAVQQSSGGTLYVTRLKTIQD